MENSDRYEKINKVKRAKQIALIVHFVIVVAFILLVLLGRPSLLSENNAAQGEKHIDEELSTPAVQTSQARNRKNKKNSEAVKNTETKKDSDKKTATSTADLNEKNVFDNTLFVGNSIVVGLERWGKLDNAKFYAVEGLNVTSYYKEGLIKDGDKSYSVADEVKKSDFDMIFIMFGINELGWNNKDVFIRKYSDIIKEIQKSHPDAEIFVQSIMHVTENKDKKDKLFNNKNIEKLNKKLVKMTEDLGVHYMDINKGLTVDGYLPSSSSSDGLHLNPSYCVKWGDYLKKETIKILNEKED